MIGNTRGKAERKWPERAAACLLALCLALLPAVSPGTAWGEEAEKPSVVFSGEQSGEQLVLTLQVSRAVFNVMEYELVYDETKLLLSQSKTNEAITGTMTGRQLGGAKTPFRFPEEFAAEGGFLDAGVFMKSQAGEGRLHLLLSVDPNTKDARAVVNENGGKFIDTGEGMDLLQISFRVKEGEVFTAETVRIEKNETNSGLILSCLKESGGTVGYVDPGYAAVQLPGLEPVEQGDGESYPDVEQGGPGGDDAGPGPGDETGGIEEIDKPGGSGSGGSSGSGAGGGGSSGSGAGGSGSNSGSGSSPGFDSTAGTSGGTGSSGVESGGKENGTTGQSGAASLRDVPGHWAAASIRSLLNRQLVSGYPDGSFRPESPVSRAEFCSVLCRALGLSENPKGAADFQDARNHWAAGCIGAVKQAGIAGGTGTGRFSPEESLSRQELSVMVARAMELTPEAGDEVSYTDRKSVAPWAKNALIAVSRAGYVSGYPDGSFRPEEAVNRAEMSVIMEQLAKAREEAERK